jgi:hypothetical protein
MRVLKTRALIPAQKGQRRCSRASGCSLTLSFTGGRPSGSTSLLAYMLAKTDLDVTAAEVRGPFPSFALVFMDRHTLSWRNERCRLMECPLVISNGIRTVPCRRIHRQKRKDLEAMILDHVTDRGSLFIDFDLRLDGDHSIGTNVEFISQTAVSRKQPEAVFWHFALNRPRFQTNIPITGNRSSRIAKLAPQGVVEAIASKK